ncbi:MAG: DUF2306 domain-containing protein [Sulfitobacter sp.]
MTFDPILNASPVIQLHTAFALAAVLLTFAIFRLERGTRIHKTLGRIWVLSMALVALSSFWISEIQILGRFSPIHLLSVFVLVQLFFAVRAARRGDIQRHRRIMRGMVWGALVVAGAFTFLPGRTMFQIISGG